MPDAELLWLLRHYVTLEGLAGWAGYRAAAWLLDILMRTAGIVGMHARAPVMGHGGVPDAGILIGLMLQLLVSGFAVILMKSWARARVCTLI